ncbi:galactonate dehydratase [Microbacterium candidum]|uniref:Galactonate dehydratase n=1 Tax=Microbacterium candidum TaxID=3041922 RepID=A0ABT7MTL3_9MICO|nr:galactonate dehydratase [Microbacterium sp. ASV49]MDL9977786.1 galactonate dehydratase [Microbacterium sp. ASV49]
MKITAIDTLVVNAELRNWVFVKVSTDVDGLVGWGEATLEWKARAVQGAVADLADIVIGQDPRRVEFLWQAMCRDPFFQGGVVTMSALSGIDQALWDIVAKHYDVPAYEVLGGRVRDKLRMYDHLGGGSSSSVYGAADDEFGAAALRSREDGFTALKVLAVPSGTGLPSAPDLRRTADIMRSIRDAVGDDVDVMVDFHGRPSVGAAIAYGRVLEEFDPWFIEEPVQPGNSAGLVQVRDALRVPIATGERLISLQDFRDHLAVGAAAVLQPDICHVGGPTALRKIAAMAESHHIPLAPHNPLGPLATAVNQHVAFATPGVMIQEVMRSDVPWRDEVVSPAAPIVDGFITAPAGPGWGVSIDEEAAAQHPYRPEPQLAVRGADGSVADW